MSEEVTIIRNGQPTPVYLGNAAASAVQAALAAGYAAEAEAAADSAIAAVQGGSVGKYFDGTISSTAGAATFTGNWTVPSDAALTVAAKSLTFNSPGTAKNLRAKLKNGAGSGDYKGCFESDWEIDTTFTLLGAFGAADIACARIGFVDGVGRFYGVRLASHPASASLLFYYLETAGNQAATAPGGYTYAVNDTIRVRARRSGNVMHAVVNWNGGADVPLSQTMNFSAASIAELPRLFSTPVIDFYRGHIRCDSAAITVAGGNAAVAVGGTSLSQGHVVSDYALGWAQRLKAAHPGQVMVCGAPSATSGDWVDALPDLLATSPAEVVLECFANDVTLTVPLSTTQANVAMLAAQCEAAGVTLRLLNAPPHNSFAVAINSWLATTDYMVRDIFTPLVGTSPALNPLYVAAPPSGSPHWNDDGHDVVFDTVNPWLIDLGSFTRIRYRVSDDPALTENSPTILPPQSAVRGFSETRRIKAARLRTLHLLQDSIARANYQPPALMPSPPTIGAAVASTTIATGTSWDFEPADNHAGKFTFVGGDWAAIGSTFPNNQIWKGTVARQGNGTDATLNPIYGGRVRFATEAPLLELWVQCAASGGGNGFRLKVDGQYAKAGVLGNDGNGLLRYIPITWGSGGAGDRKLRHYELDFNPVGAFLGIRTENLYKPAPWPQADGLRVLHHGDSLLATISDSGTLDTYLQGNLGHSLAAVIGQADFIASGTGGAGWFTPAVKTQSWFNDRVAIDVVARAPDVIIETGGGNDEAQLTAGTVTQAQYQAAVEAWLSAVLTAKPETIVLMTGPLIVSQGTALGHVRARDAKAAAAAKWPLNVAFIDNLTDPWVFGTGRQGATAGNGNRDWIAGPDSAHPTLEGGPALAGRIARGAAAAIPALIAANQA